MHKKIKYVCECYLHVERRKILQKYCTEIGLHNI